MRRADPGRVAQAAAGRGSRGVSGVQWRWVAQHQRPPAGAVTGPTWRVLCTPPTWWPRKARPARLRPVARRGERRRAGAGGRVGLGPHARPQRRWRRSRLGGRRCAGGAGRPRRLRGGPRPAARPPGPRGGRRPRPMVARRATAAARPRARRRPTRTIRTTRRRRCGAPQPAHPGQRPAPGAHPLKGRAGRVALPPPAALRRRWGHPHAHVPPARPARAPPRVAALTAVCPRARRTAGGWRCGGPRASAARGCARCGAPTRTASRARSRTPRPPWPTGVRPSPQQLKKDCSAVRS